MQKTDKNGLLRRAKQENHFQRICSGIFLFFLKAMSPPLCTHNCTVLPIVGWNDVFFCEWPLSNVCRNTLSMYSWLTVCLCFVPCSPLRDTCSPFGFQHLKMKKSSFLHNCMQVVTHFLNSWRSFEGTSTVLTRLHVSMPGHDANLYQVWAKDEICIHNGKRLATSRMVKAQDILRYHRFCPSPHIFVSFALSELLSCDQTSRMSIFNPMISCQHPREQNGSRGVTSSLKQEKRRNSERFFRSGSRRPAFLMEPLAFS